MIEKRNLSRKRILKELYFSNTLSCAELCVKIGKSVPITTKLLNDLIEEGNVVEKGCIIPTIGCLE